MTTRATPTTRTRRAPTPARATADSPAAVLARAEAKAKCTHWEDALYQQIKAAHLPLPERNRRWHPTRRYVSEFVYPDQREMLLVEVDGGVWLPKGGHTSGRGYERDRERDCEALVLGFTVLRVTPSMIKSGAAVRYLELTLHMLWTRNRKRGAA